MANAYKCDQCEQFFELPPSHIHSYGERNDNPITVTRNYMGMQELTWTLCSWKCLVALGDTQFQKDAP